MLWKKESNSTNAMYIDLFRGESVQMQYVLHKFSKSEYNFERLNDKNDVIAEKHRRNGNISFDKGRFSDALEWYNKSLCFAKIGSKTLGLAYANRSTCFLKMKMFKNCLVNIELAIQNQYPAQLMKKLEKRKNDCQKLMETEDDQSDSSAAKLDFEANEQFPCLASIVNIESSDEFGHRIVATADIEIGKTVMVEQCYIGVTKFDHYKTCNICLKENQNFIPCKKCTSALFCSDCKDNDLHGIECNINFGCPAGYKFMDVVRSVSLAKNAFANVDELIAFVENMLKNGGTIQPLNRMDAQSKYRAFFESCPDWWIYGLCLEQAYLFYQLLLEQTEMATFFRTNAHRRFLMHLVHHHILMILWGAYNKRIAPIGGEGITDTYINIVAKNLKHSCTPNVCHVLRNGSINCIVIRPIIKGEQLFISYVTLYDFGTEAQRREWLKQRSVNCGCKRCELKPLPSNHQMKSDLNFQHIQSMFKMQTFHKGLYDRKKVDTMKEKCFDFLQKFGQMQCSAELYHIIDVLYLLLSK